RQGFANCGGNRAAELVLRAGRQCKVVRADWAGTAGDRVCRLLSAVFHPWHQQLPSLRQATQRLGKLSTKVASSPRAGLSDPWLVISRLVIDTRDQRVFNR